MLNKGLIAAAVLAGAAAAFPTADTTDHVNAYPYIRPKATDSRAPCPGLNTLANHGYLPRDGRNVTRDDLINGFLNGFGVDESVINQALEIAFQTCMWIEGRDCGNTLTNLTMVGEPHMFEHDMSITRQDYNMAYSGPNHYDDAANFNETIFQQSLDIVGKNSHIDYQLYQQFRLARESNAIENDTPGWFLEAREVGLVEAGFQFAAFGDFNLPDYEKNPQIRVDWWKYWIMNESFPTPLGWHKPSPAKNITFLLSASLAVQEASVTSLPPYLPSTYKATSESPGLFPSISPTTIYALPTEAPYYAPGKVIKRNVEKAGAAAPGASRARRDAAPNPTAQAHFERLQRAEELVGPNTMVFNPYVHKVDADGLHAIKRYQEDRRSKLASVYAQLSAADAAVAPAPTN